MQAGDDQVGPAAFSAAFYKLQSMLGLLEADGGGSKFCERHCLRSPLVLQVCVPLFASQEGTLWLSKLADHCTRRSRVVIRVYLGRDHETNNMGQL